MQRHDSKTIIVTSCTLIIAACAIAAAFIFDINHLSSSTLLIGALIILPFVFLPSLIIKSNKDALTQPIYTPPDQNAWKSLASTLDLTYVYEVPAEEHDLASLKGHLYGIPVLLSPKIDQGDIDTLDTQPRISYSLQAQHPTPLEFALSIRPHSTLDDIHDALTNTQELETGDARFDAIFAVYTDSPDLCLPLLTADFRNGLLCAHAHNFTAQLDSNSLICTRLGYFQTTQDAQDLLEQTTKGLRSFHDARSQQHATPHTPPRPNPMT